MPTPRRRVSGGDGRSLDPPKTTRRQGGPSAPVRRPMPPPKVSPWIQDMSLGAREGMRSQYDAVRPWFRPNPYRPLTVDPSTPIHADSGFASPDSIAHAETDPATRFSRAFGDVLGGRSLEGPTKLPHVGEYKGDAEYRRREQNPLPKLGQILKLIQAQPRQGTGRGFRGF